MIAAKVVMGMGYAGLAPSAKAMFFMPSMAMRRALI